MNDPVEPFDLERIFFNHLPLTYLGEVALRTLVMFGILLLALSISGKREVRQLSVYELVLVIGLGSAAGDPMFYHDVPLGSAIIVFVVMMIAYKVMTRLSDRYRTLRERLEGTPVYVIQDGQILNANFNDEDIGQDELFADLRQAGIENLGQIRLAILEPNGSLSLFQFSDQENRPGLPILPHLLLKAVHSITEPGTYACLNCGYVQHLQPVDSASCPVCSQTAWVKAMDVDSDPHTG